MIMNVEDLDKYCNRSLDRSKISEAAYRTAPFDDYCLKVIMVVLWKREMRTNRNVLILNLALSNLVLALINIPFLWLPSIDFEFPYSRFFCKFANVLPGSNIYCSTLTICVMAVDRYYSVKQLRIASNRHQCMKAIFISLIIWIVSFFLSLPLLLYYDTTMLYVIKDVNVYDEKGVPKLRSYGWRQCRLIPSQSTTLKMSTQEIQLLMSVLQVVSLYVVPIFVLSIFNMKLTRFLKMNANQMARNRLGSRRRNEAQNAKKYDSYGAETLSHSNVSIAERTSHRRTNRTTALLIAMAGSYGALWLPFTVISLLLDLDILYVESHVSVIERIDQTCKMVSMLSICVNPFLYGFLNTNFRQEFSEIYLRYVICKTKNTNKTRFNHDFSSLAATTKYNSGCIGVNEARSDYFPILHRPSTKSLDEIFSLQQIGQTFRKTFTTIKSSFLLSHMDRYNCEIHLSKIGR
ncbi:7 transmembrane receptor [Dictyocaulus viviparus]|uniref:7 transmembrane receptor n=1 Tax=Dictyocaulus viviparus TaxID=29172 RepID=A0A0D8XA74_DICVI|nr:7 transmembrane receptor [Dictyocaulus viviparus]